MDTRLGQGKEREREREREREKEKGYIVETGENSRNVESNKKTNVGHDCDVYVTLRVYI